MMLMLKNNYFCTTCSKTTLYTWNVVYCIHTLYTATVRCLAKLLENRNFSLEFSEPRVAENFRCTGGPGPYRGPGLTSLMDDPALIFAIAECYFVCVRCISFTTATNITAQSSRRTRPMDWQCWESSSRYNWFTSQQHLYTDQRAVEPRFT